LIVSPAGGLLSLSPSYIKAVLTILTIINYIMIINGYSRLERHEKLDLLLHQFSDPDQARKEIESYRHNDPRVQKIHDGFSENTITNFVLPYGVAPNFLINGRYYIIPMVTEESSVVAAAAKSAKFWSGRGGFTATVREAIKNGQLHFTWKGNYIKLKEVFPSLRSLFLTGTGHITSNMAARGGGIRNIELLDKRNQLDDYFQISVDFDTCNSMGANFINSCLEEFGFILKEFLRTEDIFDGEEKEVSIIMAVLSNYSDNCIVTVETACETGELQEIAGDITATEFAGKFQQAVQVANLDVHRATTHNKGIFNGIDAVVIATGNDFRAVESAGHAWAARKGQYSSLSESGIDNGLFYHRLTLPLSVGTVGGMTGLHPMARRSLEILGNPDASELMGIIAAAGLASNFAAISSLITNGIQTGHMKMHLSNILYHLNADDSERQEAIRYFANRKPGFAAVGEFINELRVKKQ
jgi:hydroxymethylglutaryl-CoA reductase